MSQHHLRLVCTEPVEPEPPERTILGTGRTPWTWFGLMAATVIAPLAERLADTLSGYELRQKTNKND